MLTMRTVVELTGRAPLQLSGNDTFGEARRLVVCGGVGSGKTSLLHALLSELYPVGVTELGKVVVPHVAGVERVASEVPGRRASASSRGL